MPKHPPYSPDLAPCDFYLFPEIKSVLKGAHFVSVENVKAKTAEILNSLTEQDLRNCFEHWQHSMQLYVNSEGGYFEGDRSWFPEFVKQKEVQAPSRFLCRTLFIKYVITLKDNLKQHQTSLGYAPSCYKIGGEEMWIFLPSMLDFHLSDSSVSVFLTETIYFTRREKLSNVHDLLSHWKVLM